MSGLFGVLNMGAGALRTNQRDLATTGHNIANAESPGYSRQTTLRRAREGAPGTGGAGVEVDVVERLRDRFVEREYLAGREAGAFADARASWLSQVELPFDESSTSGVGDALGELFNAFRGLSSTPRDASARVRVRSAAEGLALSLQRADASLQRTAEGIDAALADDAAQATVLAQRVASLNALIGRTSAAGGPPNDLLDQRDEAARALIEKTGGQLLDSGSSFTVLVGGRPLVEGERAGSLATANSASGARLVMRDPGGDAVDVTKQVTRGSLGAALESRDTTIADLRGRLDQLAFDVATRVNEVHRAGVGLDGVGSRELFTAPTQVAGAAKALSLSAAVRASTDAIAAGEPPAAGSPANPGDNRNALALAAVGDESRAALGGLRASSYWSRAATDAGRYSADAAGAQEAEAARLDQAMALREHVSGVSVDEEMTQVLRIQAAFQASAKIVSAADEMLQSLMKLG